MGKKLNFDWLGSGAIAVMEHGRSIGWSIKLILDEVEKRFGVRPTPARVSQLLKKNPLANFKETK